MAIRLADTHAHLQESQFDADRDAVVARAVAAGVSVIVVPGVDLETSCASIELSRRHAAIHAAAGYHPHDAKDYGGAEARGIEQLVSSGDVVAVGEIGLDYYRLYSPKADQMRTLDAMLDLAESAALPVIVHCRDAHADLLPKLTAWSHRASPKAGRPVGVMHYFSGDLDLAQRYAGLGFLISIHTSVTHPKASLAREVARSLPLDLLVLETDAPYGAPQSQRGRRNEPAYVREAAALIAAERGMSVEALAAATTANARRLFRLEAPVEAAETGVAG